jgi:signal transduction histidine kinase
MIEQFIENDIKNRKIIIKGYKDKNIILSIKDNAGGIDEMIIDKIFQPNFTTKKQGSGMGLYLAKLILDKIDAKIEIKNHQEGAEFMIIF